MKEATYVRPAIYVPPAIADHGTLLDLTQMLDGSLVGVASKVVSFAVVSGPLGGSGLPDTSTGGGGGTPDAGNVLGKDGSGGNVPASTPGSTNGGGNPGGVLGDSGQGGSSGQPGGGGSAGASGSPLAGEVGRLPFTGYGVMLVAGVGAALSGAGVALKGHLRRRPQPVD